MFVRRHTLLTFKQSQQKFIENLSIKLCVGSFGYENNYCGFHEQRLHLNFRDGDGILKNDVILSRSGNVSIISVLGFEGFFYRLRSILPSKTMPTVFCISDGFVAPKTRYHFTSHPTGYEHNCLYK